MKKSYIVITILLSTLAALCLVLFELVQMHVIKDDVLADNLLRVSLSRISLGALFAWLMFLFAGGKYLFFNRRFFINLAWSLPCFMVALVNFPYSGVINGTVSIIRTDLIGLYILYVFGIALVEELIFRGIMLYLADDLLRNKKHKPLFTVLICSLVFSLFHLTNIFVGAGIGATLLQVLYTFLIGAMLTVTMLKLKNVWLCVLIHGVFNFGGLLTMSGVATGNPWDMMFWILTITSGVLAAGHIIFSLIKLEKAYVSE